MSELQPAYHAVLGPSSAHRWRKCTASVQASHGEPNDAGEAARMGTACHAASAECLLGNAVPHDFLGRKFFFTVHEPTGGRYEDFAEVLILGVNGGDLELHHEFEFADEHIEWITAYVMFVREQHELLGGELIVERQVPVEHITGEPGARGTVDVQIVAPPLITIIDAKFGRNRVTAYETVRAPCPDPFEPGVMLPALYAPNDQLAMYAGGAIEQQRLFNDFETAKLIIVQPPLLAVSEFTLSVADLETHLDQVRVDAEATRTQPTFNAGDHCVYCPARVNCKPRDAAMLDLALEGFTDVTSARQLSAATLRKFEGNYLGVVLARVDEIESWCSDIRQRALDMLNEGGDVIAADGTRFKLVQGKRGARRWRDAKAVEAYMRDVMRMRKDEMYAMKVISPTAAEALAKQKRAKKGETPAEPLIGKIQWNRLQSEIDQPEGKVVVAHGSDPRPAYEPAVSGFTDSPTPADDADLF